MIAKIIEAPDKSSPGRENGWDNIFLAGTIEQGNSDDWQSVVINKLKAKRVNIFNPRRSTWDASWIQDFSPEKVRTI